MLSNQLGSKQLAAATPAETKGPIISTERTTIDGIDYPEVIDFHPEV
jgi:hypothetical protein